MSDKNLITIKNLHFSRGHKIIFNGIDITIPKGKITAIMGPSGTGKTTLLKLIGAQLKAAQGSIVVDGESVFDINKKQLFVLRKKMGMLFQSGALLTDISVFDNVAFPLRENTQLPEYLIHHLVLMRLQSVGLRGAKDLMPNELSGGMARRVALARALIMDPMLIMYDEPFTGQDPISKGVLVELIKTLNDALGLTSIMVSHDIKETLQIADLVYVVSDGKIVGKGSPKALKNSNSGWVKQFIGAAVDGPVPFHYDQSSYIDDLMRSNA
jgi:phospholipid/cholesterol/gamma-HCH transport system ATP-binding protein